MDSARKSLFFYQQGESWDTFYFSPYYYDHPNFGIPEHKSQALPVCDEDRICHFDIAATGIVDVGIANHENGKYTEDIYSFSIPGKAVKVHYFFH